MSVLKLARLDKVFPIHASLEGASRPWLKRRGPRLFVTSVGMRSVQAVRETGYLRRCWSNPSTGCWRVSAAGNRCAWPPYSKEAMSAGVNAVPIVGLASFATGMMLAIQGIHTLRTFGAEDQVVLGIALGDA